MREIADVIAHVAEKTDVHGHQKRDRHGGGDETDDAQRDGLDGNRPAQRVRQKRSTRPDLMCEASAMPKTRSELR